MIEPSKGDTIWRVSSEGTIHTYTFVECGSQPGAKHWMLAYGTHPKQRNWVDSRYCHRTREAACVAAAKMLRERAEFFLTRARELEQEAAGLPVIPRGPATVYVKPAMHRLEDLDLSKVAKEGQGDDSEG